MEKDINQSAGTIEEEVIETDTIESEEVVDDADNDESNADFSDGEEAGDDKEPEPQPEPEKEKPWKSEQNAEQARKRREAERQAEIKKARTEAIIETLNGVNPYTNEKIEDDADVEEYLTMKEIEKSGKDPVADYSRYLKNKTKEQEKTARETASQEEWLIKDREDFLTKHPDVKFNELVSDEMFRTFAEGKLGKIAMTKIYADYKSFEKRSEESAKTKAAQILANKAATPGKMSKQPPTLEKSIDEMSLEEFRAFDEKVKRGEIKLK